MLHKIHELKDSLDCLLEMSVLQMNMNLACIDSLNLKGVRRREELGFVLGMCFSFFVTLVILIHTWF